MAGDESRSLSTRRLSSIDKSLFDNRLVKRVRNVTILQQISLSREGKRERERDLSLKIRNQSVANFVGGVYSRIDRVVFGSVG